jgi:hypothetical protein
LPSLGTKAAPVSALLLLCFLWACAALRFDLFPGSIRVASPSALASEAAPLALFAVIAAIAALVYKASWPRGTTLGATVLAGLGLFAVPSALIEIAKGAIDDATRVALFSLVPVFAVVFDPHLGSGSSPQQRGGLMASLIAVCGTLLVFPLDVPRSAGAAFACCGIVAAAASVAAANCLSVRLACGLAARSAQQRFPSSSIRKPLLPSGFFLKKNPPSSEVKNGYTNCGTALSFAAVAAGSAAVALGVWSAVFERGTWSASRFGPWTTLDLLALVLLFWLMTRMNAVRMTTRFLVAPLLANLIGLWFLRPSVQGRGWFGLMLIAAGSGWLLLGPEEEPEETGSPLHINEP